MEPVTRLAFHLDLSALQARRIPVADENVDDDDLPYCNPADQLHDRLLIKYIREDEVEKYSAMRGKSHFPGCHHVTPTPIACSDLKAALALPLKKRPKYALLLLPEKLTSVRGPRRITGGYGIEYVLEDGFTSDAIAKPTWALEYR